MAQYEQLPVYQEAYALLVEVKIQIRILKFMEVISKKQYLDLSQKIIFVLKQSEG